MSITWVSDAISGSVTAPFEMHNTAKASFNASAWTADVQLCCAWLDRYVIADDMLDNFKEWPYLVNSGMYCTSVSITPAPGAASVSDGGLVYELALLDCHFEHGIGQTGTPGGEEGAIALYDEVIEPAGEFITMDHRLFRWSSDNTQLKAGEAPGRLVIRNVYTVKWTRLSSVPFAAFEAVNHVNDGPVTSPSLGVTFDTGTLLMASAPATRTVTTVANAARFDLTIRLVINPDGWSTFWRAATESYDTFYKNFDDNDYENYPTYDMSGFLP